MATWSLAAGLMLMQWAPVLAGGLPEGGTVVGGQASIRTPNVGRMVIDQSTQAAAINWQSFDIGANDSVQFVQPGISSVTLNRVVGTDPSTIFGKLSANGQVFLVNLNGVLFAPGSSIDVGGIVASSLGITDANFFAGDYHFSGASHGTVVNEGRITAAHAGYVALIGPSVSNEGTISSPGGAVALGAGSTVDLTLASNTLESFQVSAASVDALVSNGGAIRAAGGRVILSAQARNALLQTVVNNTGIISADSAVDDGGTISLIGQGGVVQTGGQITASSRNAAGGTLTVSGSSVTVDAGAQLLASGATAGGTIRVGGDLHGGNLPLATTTTVDAGAVLNASATAKGNGGGIQVVANTSNPVSRTSVSGTLISEGGPQGGDGGTIETSGSTLNTAGISIQAGAANGTAGEWLLDPTMIEIGTSDSGTTSSTSGGTTTYTGTGTSYVSASTIDSTLNSGTNVTVQTTGLPNNGAFDIWLVSPITKTSGGNATLTLQAANSVYVGAPISSTSGLLNVNLYAGNNGGTLTGTGAVLLASDITTNGGSINFGTNQTYTFTNSGVTRLAGGDVYVDSQLTTSAGGGSASNQVVKLDTTPSSGSAGSVNIYGQTVIANPSGFEIDTQHAGTTGNDGNVYFAGTVDSGNTFQLVSGSYTWDQAYLDAASGTGANVGDTYLATPSTSLLNAVASFTANYNQAWLGAERLLASTVTGTPNPTDTTSLDNIWYWVGGPLGLAVNPSSPTGYGTAFFTQYGSITQNGQSGTPINGAYTNWNPATSLASGNLGTQGEPNNDSGTNLTPSGAHEYVMQFVGTAGQWNDLPPSSTMSYVKETNLAAAPLVVNSGQGTITLGAGVGTNAPLESFNATGNIIDLPQSPAIDTTGGTTINGQVQVYNGTTYTNTTLLTVAAKSSTSTYGSTPPSSLPITYTVQGQAPSSGPPANVGAASASWSATPTATSNVGIYDATVSGATCNSCGYTFLYVPGSLTVTPAPLTASGLTAISRTYDGTTSITLNGSPSLSGLMNGDAGTVTGALTGAVASPNVQLLAGVAQSQSVTTALGFSLTVGNPSDYTFVQPALTATISPAPVTVSGLSPINFTYNGSPTVALSGTSVFTGLLGSQTLGIANLSTGAVAASADAGTEAVTGQLQLADGTNGGLASNYTLSAQPTLADVSISPAPVTISGLSPINFTYNGSPTVGLSGTPVFTGLVGSQTLGIANLGTGAVAASADAGTEAVTGQLQLADGANGGLASNYTLSAQPTLADVSINPAPLTVSGLSPINFTYNGSSIVGLSGTPVFTGLVGSQTLGIANLGTGAVAASADAGTEAVTGQLQLADGANGGLANNYSLSAQPTLADVAISPAPVTVVGSIAVPMTYDGSGKVSIIGAYLKGVVPGDSVTLVNNATIDPKLTGVAIPVSFQDSLAGVDANNYVIAQQPQGVTVSVLPLKSTVVAPVQEGTAAPSAVTANTSSATVSTFAIPPIVVAGASRSETSIAVIDGGVNAPASALQPDGFLQTLQRITDNQRRATVSRTW